MCVVERAVMPGLLLGVATWQPAWIGILPLLPKLADWAEVRPTSKKTCVTTFPIRERMT